jgi:hypothetical protein
MDQFSVRIKATDLSSTAARSAMRQVATLRCAVHDLVLALSKRAFACADGALAAGIMRLTKGFASGTRARLRERRNTARQAARTVPAARSAPSGPIVLTAQLV